LCKTLDGKVEVNQISATSKITVPTDTKFSLLKKGIGNFVSFESNGEKVDSFAVNEDETDNMIELNGVKSELVIAK
jgi:hypothetical protein